MLLSFGRQTVSQYRSLPSKEERRIIIINVLGFAGYCLFFFLLKDFGATAATFVSGKEIYHAQEFRWIYDAANPPLYTWLLYLLNQALGTGLTAIFVLNYLLLFLIFVATLLLARHVLRSAALAALAAWSLLLIGYIHNIHYTQSHSLVAIIFYTLALTFVMRATESRSAPDYAAAGVAIGAGLLSKFIMLGTAGAMVVAALVRKPSRIGVLNRKSAITVALAALIFVPLVVAASDQWSRLVWAYRDRTGQLRADGYISGLMDGLASLISGLAWYALPLTIVLLIAVIPVVWGRRNPDWQEVGSSASQDRVAFLVMTMAVGLAMIVISILAGEVTKMRARFLAAFFYPLPIVAVALLIRYAPDRAAFWRYRAGILVVGSATVAIRVINLSPICFDPCLDLVPYPRLSQHLYEAGFRQGTILARGVTLAGNLLLTFPKSRADVGVDPFTPHRLLAGRNGQCLIIWRAGAVPAGTVPKELIAVAGISLQAAKDRTRSVTIDWRWHGRPIVNPMQSWEPRRTTWHYILLDPGTSSCR